MRTITPTTGRLKRVSLVALAIVLGVSAFIAVISTLPSLLNTKVAAAPEPWEATGGWTQISAAYDSAATCGISGGKAYCWGYGSDGKLGNGTSSSFPIPEAVNTSGVLSGKTVTSVTMGQSHSCALTTQNLAYCWGTNNYGQLGDGTTTNSNVPVAVAMTGPLAGKTILKIVAGQTSNCVIASDNQAYCWGYGYLGAGNTDLNDYQLVAVDTSGVLAGKTILDIEARQQGYCVIASDNQAYCWGTNYNGQLGDGSLSNTPQLSPVAVDTTGVLAGKTILSLGLGGDHACAVASDNRAYCWGLGSSGQLGDQSTGDQRSPVLVNDVGPLAGKTILSVDVGSLFTCFLASDNKVYCVGDNEYGALGIGNEIDSLTPVAVDTSGVLSGKTITSIDLGVANACVIDSTTQAYCWGVDNFGRLGTGSSDESAGKVLSPKIIGRTPQITNISPAKVLIDGTAKTVNIIGLDFSEDAVVEVDGEVVSSTYFSAGQLVVSLPTLGVSDGTTMDISVTNVNGQSVTVSDGIEFSLFTPTITSVSPDAIGSDSSGTETVTISGTNFVSGSVVRFGTEVAESTYINSTTINVNIYPGDITETNTVDVTVTNPNDETVTLVDGFTYTYVVPPPIEVTSATIGELDGKRTLALEGTGFMRGIEDDGIGIFLGAYVSLNGETMKYCSPHEGFGIPSMQSFINLLQSELSVDVTPYVTDGPTCYQVFDSEGTQTYSDTSVLIIFDDSYDLGPDGIVSVNGSADFTYDGLNTPTEETPGGSGGSGGGSGTPAKTPTKQITTPEEFIELITKAKIEKSIQVGTQSLGDATTTVESRPTFSGTAPEGTKVTVTVHSDPVSCSAVADSNNHWSCTLPSDLPAGSHSAMIAMVTPAGDSYEFGPYQLAVAEKMDPPVSQTDIDTEQIDKASGYNGFATIGWIVGGAVAAIIIITIIVFVVRNRRL